MLSRFSAESGGKLRNLMKSETADICLQSSSILVISVLLSDEWLTNGTLQYASMASLRRSGNYPGNSGTDSIFDDELIHDTFSVTVVETCVIYFI